MPSWRKSASDLQHTRMRRALVNCRKFTVGMFTPEGFAPEGDGKDVFKQTSAVECAGLIGLADDQKVTLI